MTHNKHDPNNTMYNVICCKISTHSDNGNSKLVSEGAALCRLYIKWMRVTWQYHMTKHSHVNKMAVMIKQSDCQLKSCEIKDIFTSSFAKHVFANMSKEQNSQNKVFMKKKWFTVNKITCLIQHHKLHNSTIRKDSTRPRLNFLYTKCMI